MALPETARATAGPAPAWSPGELDEHFARALDQPAGQLSAYLARTIVDPDLRHEVATLLAAHHRAGAFLAASCLEKPPAWLQDHPEGLGLNQTPSANEGPWSATEIGSAAPSESDWVGQRVGAWRLVKRLGAGGMGTVYLGQRIDGEFEQRVAIKFADRALASNFLAERFAEERRILARLDHPGIARIFDGGTSPAGLPYLVMELVEGLPIDLYCAEHQLELDARLDLFLGVLDAVEFAHRALVIHRDLKPAHVVINAQGQVKLLDFGIAKWLDTQERQLDGTQTVDFAFTPNYASPEQFRGDPLTTATDVYSLGVILFKVLTGELPRQLAWEFSGHLTVREPPALRGRRFALGPGGRPLALSRDLEAIVHQALAVDWTQRYPTAAALADDLRRLRRGYPVRARPSSLLYQARRTVGRHRLPFFLLATILLTLVVFSYLSVQQAQSLALERDRSRTESRRAAASASFLRELLAKADEERGGGRSISVRDALDAGANRLVDEENLPLADRLMQHETLGTIYRSVGAFPESRRWLEQGLSLALQQGDILAEANFLFELGQWEIEAGSIQQAEKLHREALAIRREHLPADDPELLESIDGLARLLGWSYATLEQAALEQEEIEIRRRIFGPEDPITLIREARHTQTLVGLDFFDRACPLAAEALKRLENAPWDRRDFLQAWALANTRRACGALDEAETLFRRLEEKASRMPGLSQFAVSFVRNDLALVWYDQGRFAEAEAALEKVVANLVRLAGPETLNATVLEMNLAEVRVSQGRFAEAAVTYQRAIQYFEREKMPGGLAEARLGLAACWLGLGRGREAELEIQATLPWLEAHRPPGHSSLDEANGLRAAAWLAQGKTPEGQTLWRSSLSALDQKLGPHHPRRRRLETLHGRHAR